MIVWRAVALVLAIGVQFGLGRMSLSNSNSFYPTWNKSSELLSSEPSPRQLSQWWYGDSIEVQRIPDGV